MTSTFHPPRHWVIGDVHGCAQSLQDLVSELPPADRLIFCGDLINRGPRILEAMELAWDLVSSGRAVWLKGNHEADLVEALVAAVFVDGGLDAARMLVLRWLQEDIRLAARDPAGPGPSEP